MKQRGLTLLEVVIALMLFAMISVFLLSGHAKAAEATLHAEVERAMAELLSFRLNMVALEHEEYEDGDEGSFPHLGAGDRLVDEEEIFSDRFGGYTWRVEISETIGTGATGPVSVDDSDPRDLLFAEEGGGGDAGDDEADATSEEVDQMLFIRVTIYPPGYDPSLSDEDMEQALQPRSAWTAIHLPREETEGSNR